MWSAWNIFGAEKFNEMAREKIQFQDFTCYEMLCVRRFMTSTCWTGNILIEIHSKSFPFNLCLNFPLFSVWWRAQLTREIQKLLSQSMNLQSTISKESQWAWKNIKVMCSSSWMLLQNAATQRSTMQNWTKSTISMLNPKVSSSSLFIVYS